MAREDSQFKPGERRTGRQAGTKNRVSTGLRDTFIAVFDELQEDEDCNLKQWAMENPTEFYRLVARLLPQEYTGDFYTVIEVKLKDEQDENLSQSTLAPPVKPQADAYAAEDDFG